MKRHDRLVVDGVKVRIGPLPAPAVSPGCVRSAPTREVWVGSSRTSWGIGCAGDDGEPGPNDLKGIARVAIAAQRSR